MSNNKQKRQIVLSAIKMVDASEKLDAIKPPSKNRKYYPSIYLRGDQVPDLDGVDIGKEIKIVCDAVIRSKSLSDNDKVENVSIEIRKIGLV